jgi:hypothetical protein
MTKAIAFYAMAFIFQIDTQVFSSLNQHVSYRKN